MKHIVPALVLLLSLTATLASAASPYATQWREVDAAVAKGLPKTAIAKLEPLAQQAVADRAYAEAARAICTRIALEGNIEGNKPEEKVTRLRAAITNAPAPMRPVLDTILANWYWHFYQQNRWRFAQRTRTAEAPSSDFTTWDLPRILAAIDAQFQLALTATNALQATPIAAYDALLEKGTMPDVCRPTLFDFVAQNAVDFYAIGEQAGNQAEDAFVLQADSPIFGTANDFLAWNIDTPDATSPTAKGIHLLQNLLLFHRPDADPTAFLDADLRRLEFGAQAASGEQKTARYRDALKRFAETHADHPLSARARAGWARIVWETDKDPLAALAIAEHALADFPTSIGGALCYNLIQDIRTPSLKLNTERVWNAGTPELDVSYRNLTNVQFRVYAADFDSRVNNAKNVWQEPGALDDDESKRILRGRPTLAWSAPLPATTNHLSRLQHLTPPPGLKPGFYFLFAASRSDFSGTNDEVSCTSFWVSDLALVVHARHRDASLEGLVLEAASGTPIPDAQVGGWVRRGDKRSALKPVATDSNGWFRIEGTDNCAYLLLASHGQQRLAMSDNQWLNGGGKPRWPQSQTVLFTDRSLYRPGQTIRYKGICIRSDQPKGIYAVMPEATVTVVLQDPNGKDVARQFQHANAWGSFDGSFTAPRDRLMGQMTLRVEAGPHGEASFGVEEYKRPKFQVHLDAPKEPARLNAQVTVTGRATAYTGVPISDAKVSYRVAREVRFPVWWHWCCWRAPEHDAQEITHGMVRSANDGSFSIPFVARPSPGASPTSEVTFAYTINADVTDSTGETRSDEQSVNVGFTALQADLAADEWQTVSAPAALTVTTQTLDDEPCSAQGSVRVYRLVQPIEVVRQRLAESYGGDPFASQDEPEPEADRSNPNAWPLGDIVAEKPFKTDASGRDILRFRLDAGAYRVMLSTRDAFGRQVTARCPLLVADEHAAHFPVHMPSYMVASQGSAQPGETFRVVWGSGYVQARAFIELECAGKPLRRFWTDVRHTQESVPLAITEALRGGFVVRVTSVHDNRADLQSRTIDVPWSNKVLNVKWEHFVSKLTPGKPETWSAVVSGANATRVAAEVVSTLYDASLDAYMTHHWDEAFDVFRGERDDVRAAFLNHDAWMTHTYGNWLTQRRGVEVSYRDLPDAIADNLNGYQYLSRGTTGRNITHYAERLTTFAACCPSPSLLCMEKTTTHSTSPRCTLPAASPAPAEACAVDASLANDPAGRSRGGQAPHDARLDQLTARKNLAETAFFFPHLTTDEKGVVSMTFTMPEALTQWRFMAFAHDKNLRAGLLEDKAVTTKDLMVEPNPPRFVREGDTIEFSAKVSNRSATKQKGTVRLTFADARSLASVDEALKNREPDQAFHLAAGESKSFSWRLTVPDGMGFLTYKAVAATDAVSDGEEGPLPVLSRRVLVIESLPLSVRGAQTRGLLFDRLLDAGKSDTLRHQSLTLQMVSQPAWYAVMALPYLMEYPYECSEQTFNRLYANALARHIAQADPKIRRIFDLWRDTPALDSPLEKSQDLKSVMLEETPWYRQAQDEKQARQRVGVLFDDNRLNDEQRRIQDKLAALQYGDGRWPWFPGGHPSDFMTLHIATGYGRLRHLGVPVETAPAIKAWDALDRALDETYRKIQKNADLKEDHLTPMIALHLYGRSFFLKERPIAAEHRASVDYFLGQARTYWLKLDCRLSQAHLSLALQRFGDAETAKAIVASLRERSVANDEMGMFWRDAELSWWWQRAPIETQAVMIEAFAEVAHDDAAVDACQVWLLKQKQTQDWKTTKATADAVYALLLRGISRLASDAQVRVALGGRWIKPEQTEAGTGFYEQRYSAAAITPAMGRVTVSKTDDGVSWGSLHWQYLEDISRVSAFTGTPLRVSKTLFVRENTKQGPTLRPIGDALEVGQELVTRIELRTDRDMEYVHLKDQRGCGTEPVNVLSQYHYQDGLAYYESTRDTASHFYIDYLPKGVYVFEYAVRVVQRGRYQSGLAEAQCLYAPEFNSHSESRELTVR